MPGTKWQGAANQGIGYSGKSAQEVLGADLLALKSAGYITSRRGPDGGYQLLKPADLIYIGPMLRSIDGPIAPLPCFPVPPTSAAMTARPKLHAKCGWLFQRLTVTIS